MATDASQALEDWLFVRRYEPGPLFKGVGNRNKGGRMTPQSVFAIPEKRAVMAGIDSLSPHDLRRSFIGDLLDAGADIAVVQKLAGHANTRTTARYDRRGEQTKQKAVELLHIPRPKRILHK